MMRSLLISLGLMLVAVLLFAGTMLAVLNFKGTPVSSLFGGQPAQLEPSAPLEGVERPQSAPGPEPNDPPLAPLGPEVPALFELPGEAADQASGGRLATRLTRGEIDALAEELQTARVELERRRQALDEREAGLSQREEDLLGRRREVRSLQDQVDQARKGLDAARGRWEADQIILSGSEQKAIKRLSDMVAEMRPEDAAENFNRWLPEGKSKVVKVIAAMDPSAAAKILEKIDPKQAHEIFEALTRYREQRAEPPKGG